MLGWRPLCLQEDRKEVAELRELHTKLGEREAALEAAAAGQQQELQAAQVYILTALFCNISQSRRHYKQPLPAI